MRGNATFVDGCIELGPAKSALHPVDGRWFRRNRCLLLYSANGRKNECRVAVGRPVTAEQSIGILRQRDITILGPFAAVNMDHLPCPIDIGDLQEQTLLKPEAAGTDGHQIGIIVEGGNLDHDPFNFFSRERRR